MEPSVLVTYHVSKNDNNEPVFDCVADDLDNGFEEIENAWKEDVLTEIKEVESVVDVKIEENRLIITMQEASDREDNSLVTKLICKALGKAEDEVLIMPCPCQISMPRMMIAIAI